MVSQRVVSDLNSPVYYRWVIGHMSHELWVTWVMGQNSDGSHGSGSNYIDPLSALILTHRHTHTRSYIRTHTTPKHTLSFKLLPMQSST